MSTLQEMREWMLLNTGETVARRLVEQQVEIDAYRKKFSLHTYDPQRNEVVLNSDTAIAEGYLSPEQGKNPPAEAENAVISPEDWSLLTLSHKFFGTKKK
jgi:hypothetical protein